MSSSFPALPPYGTWRETCDTLHAHTQLLGKLAVALAPPEPQLQHAALRLTARGWETLPLPAPNGSGAVVVALDLRTHEAVAEHSDGRTRTVPLGPDRAVGSVTRELLDDPDASFRSVAVLYQDFLVRCRIRRVRGEALALPAFRRKLAVVRAGVDADTAGSETWQQALALSASLADDVQGVFLVLARAALEGAPCPSDAAIARAYGTHSTGRARRMLAYFEERGLIVVRMDLRNQRIVAFPDLGIETGPGNPDAPEYDERSAAE